MRTEPFVISSEDLASTPGALAGDDALRLAVAPIQLDHDRKGFIVSVVKDGAKPRLSERTMKLLTGIAHQARLAIANASSFENLEQTFLSTVEALANALEARDEYTSSHSRAITDMALQVGDRLGLDPTALKRLELGALFHDIGKIGIPVRDPAEARTADTGGAADHGAAPGAGRAHSRAHRSARGRPADRPPLSRTVRRGRLSGPAGGGGHPGRVVHHPRCDAFHAMTTDRSYRGRLPVEEAVRRVRDGAGTQFDPAVVKIFLNLFEPVAAAARR